jgi:translation initiation factor 5B
VHEVSKLNAERFDRVQNFTSQVAIVPTSAKSGEGMPELLMVIAGLAQKYLEKKLELNVKGPAKGVVVEVKEEKGLGCALDTVIYDGTLKVNDIIVIGGIDKPIVTKVRVLAQPRSCHEMRDRKAKFDSVKKVVAATGVKIAAPDIKNVIAGMPFQSASKSNLDIVKTNIQKEVTEVLVQTGRGLCLRRILWAVLRH